MPAIDDFLSRRGGRRVANVRRVLTNFARRYAHPYARRVLALRNLFYRDQSGLLLMPDVERLWHARDMAHTHVQRRRRIFRGSWFRHPRFRHMLRVHRLAAQLRRRNPFLRS